MFWGTRNPTMEMKHVNIKTNGNQIPLVPGRASHQTPPNKLTSRGSEKPFSLTTRRFHAVATVSLEYLFPARLPQNLKKKDRKMHQKLRDILKNLMWCWLICCGVTWCWLISSGVWCWAIWCWVRKIEGVQLNFLWWYSNTDWKTIFFNR